jgi:hypothetical protein
MFFEEDIMNEADVENAIWVVRILSTIGVFLKPLFGRGALPRHSWVPNINEFFKGDAELFGPYKHEPVIESKGAFPLNDAQATEAAKERKKIASDKNTTNDPHAVLSSGPNWNDDPLNFKVQTLDFAAVRVLRRNIDRNNNSLPQVLSANILLICRESREIILHRRAAHSDTYPNALHTIGGAYMPPKVDHREGDFYQLRLTAFREVLEESGANFVLDENPPMVVLREVKTGFIQLIFLGINISLKGKSKLKSGREGEIVYVKYDELPRRLRQENDWVPTGKAAILAWLALGAPNGGWNVKFGGIKPTKLFKQEVGAIRS